MEFKGTKGKWEFLNTELADFHLTTVICEKEVIAHISSEKSNRVANALLISKAPEMLDIIEELCENLYFQLDRLGVCGEGDGKGRKADVDSYGGTELLQRAKHLIKEATEL